MPPAGRRSRILVIVSVAVLALAGLGLAFFLGSRLQSAAPPLAAGTPTATATPTPTPTPTPPAVPAVPAGAAAPGVVSWEDLGGGECLDPFTSPWDREFTVVDCAQPHRAQLVRRGVFDGDASAAYPGEPALRAKLNLLCASPDVIDRTAAGVYADLQFQAAYPANEGEWLAGDRSYFCFVFRGSGGPITGNVAAAR